MKIPLLILVSMGLFASGTAQAVDVKADASFSGTEHPTLIDTNGDMIYASAGVFEVKGVHGRAVTHSFTEFTEFLWYGEPGCDVRAQLVSQDFVEIIKDGSMIFFSATDGFACVDLTTGNVHGEARGLVTGGTGKYAGATGAWEMTFTPHSLPTGLTAITGSITGTIELP